MEIVQLEGEKHCAVGRKAQPKGLFVTKTLESGGHKSQNNYNFYIYFIEFGSQGSPIFVQFDISFLSP